MFCQIATSPKLKYCTFVKKKSKKCMIGIFRVGSDQPYTDFSMSNRHLYLKPCQQIHELTEVLKTKATGVCFPASTGVTINNKRDTNESVHTHTYQEEETCQVKRANINPIN